MTLPDVALILVKSVKSIPGGMKEALRLLDTLPGSKMGRCEKCFCKVLLAPSTIEQKRQNPRHILICYECRDKLPVRTIDVATGAALAEKFILDARKDRS